jgi:hypothetical protein
MRRYVARDNGVLMWVLDKTSLNKALKTNALKEDIGSPSRIRTYGQVINSHLLYR